MPFSKKSNIKSTRTSIYCGIIPTSDPRVFGPPAWKTFHIFAENYPNNPNKQTQQSCINFIKSIPYMLPCETCGFDFNEFINKYLQSGKEINKNRDQLRTFFVEAHNNVSKNVDPNHKTWTLDNIRETYKSENMCIYNETWGSKKLNRTE